MTRRYVALIVGVICTWTGSTAIGRERVVSLYDVRRAETVPVIDGKLDDACWQGKPAITDMVRRGRKGTAPVRTPARHQTWTTVLYDNQALYVGIRMAEPHVELLRKKIIKYDGELWWDDSVEIYVETGSSHKEYFKFMSTPLGTRFDVQARNTPMGFKMMDWGTGAEWTVKAHTGQDFWSLEFRFPWSDFEVKPPHEGDVWTFEIVRFRYADDYKKRNNQGQYSCWNVGSHYSNPSSFGNIVFGGSTRDLEQILAERILPVTGAPIIIYGSRGEMRYTDYATLQASAQVEAHNAIAELRRLLEAVGPSVPAELRDSLKASVQGLEENVNRLAETEPGPAAAEALKKTEGRAKAIEWTLRYHQLNSEISAGGPDD